MEFTVLKTRLHVSPLFFAVLTLFLVIDKNGIAGTVLLFSVLHEASHFMALLCTKTTPKEIIVSIFGIRISLYENLSTAKKCAVLMAGFVTNFIMSFVLFLYGEKISAMISLFIGLFTAIPLPSTDGGGILFSMLDEFYPENAMELFKRVSLVLSVFISILFLSVAVISKNQYLVVGVIYILINSFKIMQ